MLGILALAIVGVTGWRWFQLIRQVAIPRNRMVFHLGFGVGAVLGLIAVVEHSGWISTSSGAIALVVGAAIPLLRLQSGQRPNEPNVRVGGPMLAFTAPDEHGVDFDLTSLTGKPYLLKFFRGHW